MKFYVSTVNVRDMQGNQKKLVETVSHEEKVNCDMYDLLNKQTKKNVPYDIRNFLQK